MCEWTSLDDGEFVAQVPYFPPLQSLETDFSNEECLRLVRAAAVGGGGGGGGDGASVNAGGGDDKYNSSSLLADAKVRSVRSWTMSAEVADVFTRGRVVLCGDAAHRFPPAGGFGMNTVRERGEREERESKTKCVQTFHSTYTHADESFAVFCSLVRIRSPGEGERGDLRAASSGGVLTEVERENKKLFEALETC